jgi:hypothetical protein
MTEESRKRGTSARAREEGGVKGDGEAGGAPEAQSNTDLSGLFRGTDASQALKDPKSGRGISATSIPAFVAGAELADLADTDDRIVVLTADLAHANRTIDFGARHPGDARLAPRFRRPGPTSELRSLP